MTVTLGEGNTPLVPSARLGAELGLRSLAFKLESCNPSGSYKDRFIAAEMGRILASGARSCVATSSGNTGSALAAYSARYGVRCTIFVNELAPEGKLSQMKAHGATIVRVREFGASARVTADTFDTLRRFSETGNLPLVVSAFRYCPVGMAGVESLGAEIHSQGGADLRHVFVPVGSGGLFAAVCQGMQGGGARVHAVQPAGCSTLVASWQRGDDVIRPVESTTRISGLSVPFDIDASLALRRLREGNGLGINVDDEAVFAAQRMLLEKEGIFSEPAGATALAGLIEALRQNRIAKDEAAVCVITGTGFKDPESIAAAAAAHPEQLLEHQRVSEYLQDTVAA